MCACTLSQWGDIANIVIAIASVATAIVTAIVLCKQYNDNKKEKQPKFSIISQGGKVSISGDITKLLAIENVILERFIELESTSRRVRRIIIPIEYFGKANIKDNYLSPVAEISENFLSNSIIAKRFFEFSSQNKDIKYRCSSCDLLKIQYRDIFNKLQTVRFLNGKIIDKKVYNDYTKRSKLVSKTPVKPKDLDFETIVGKRK